MSIRVERWLRNLVHGPYGRWIMLGLLIFILCVFTVTQEMQDWLRNTFTGGNAASASDVAGSFAVLPGDISEVTFPEFDSARRKLGIAQAFLMNLPMDRVRDMDVWAHLVLLEAAKKERIAVSATDLREVMSARVPEYIFKDTAQYRKWVPETFHGVSAAQLETAVLEYLTALRLREVYRESFMIGPAATRKAAVEQAASQSVEYALGDYAALDAGRFVAEAEEELKSEAEPDKKLKEFFDKDPSVKLESERFRHLRRYRIELLYTIHANVNSDESLARIDALVRKAYPEAKFKEVNVADRKTYFGTYRDRLLGTAGKTWEDLVKDDAQKQAASQPPKPPGDEPGAPPAPPGKPDETGKPDEPAAGNPDEAAQPGQPPGQPAPNPAPTDPAQPGQAPAEAPKPPDQPLDPLTRQRIIDYGYQIVKEQVGREVTLRSIYEFLYDQARNDVSLKEMFDRLKANDDPQSPVCGTEPGKGLIMYRDLDGKALSADELMEIEDSGVKFGFSFKPRVTGLGDTDLPKKSRKADTLGDEGHGRQFFRLLEVIREQRKTFEELTPGEKDDLKRLFYLPERARERAKEKLEALRQKLVDGTVKPEQFRAEAEALGCRVHEGEWIEATYDFLREPDKKQLWPAEYLHMRDRHFLRKSLAQVLDRDRVKQEWKAGSVLPVDVHVRREADEPGAAYLFLLRQRKKPDATTIPPGEIATYLKTFATQKNREEQARWGEEPEQLRGDFKMTFSKEMQERIDEDMRRKEEAARRKGGSR